MKHIEGKNLKVDNDNSFSCDIIKKKKMSQAKRISKSLKPKQPSRWDMLFSRLDKIEKNIEIIFDVLNRNNLK